MHSGVNGNTSILVPDDAYRPLPAELILHLDRLALGGSDVCTKSEKQVFCHPLLYSQLLPWFLRVAAKQRVKRQIGNARQFLHLAADLATQTLGEKRFRPKTGGRARAGRRGFGSLERLQRIVSLNDSDQYRHDGENEKSMDETAEKRDW